MGRVGGAPAVGGCGMLLVILIALAFGVDPSALIQSLGDVQSSTSVEQGAAPPEEDAAAQFVSVVLADTEDTWGALFAGAGQRYVEPTLVLFTDAVRSGCGLNSSSTGPFYCPEDQDVYLDLGFLNQLRRMGIQGEFSVAYVIAHEVGHHVQHLLGTQQEVQRLQRQVSQKQANQLSVLLELQADCYAGVWAHHADAQRDILDRADVEAGIQAAAAIGDDRMQQMGGQRVQPDAFTHGSSQQRAEWFHKGWDQGSVQACDTFADAGLR
jgi:predicted metalloprotease